MFVSATRTECVAALEAAFLTRRISKLILYEPPLQDRIDLAVVEEMERSIARGDREHATTAFLRRLVKLPASEVEMMRSRPSWPTLVASIDAQPRQARALAGYRFDAKRMSTLDVPTLLVTGAETASPEAKQAIRSLEASLPHRTVAVLAGQQHNAMDVGRAQLADAITRFLLETKNPR
jgi:hypothetical protein